MPNISEFPPLTRGDRIEVKTWLARNEKTQDWLANRCGVSQAYLSRVLGGYRPPTLKLVKDIRRITKIDLGNHEAVSA